jgi:hypothetical protein
MKRTSIVALAAVAIAAALFALSRTDAGQLLLGRWSFTKSLVVNDGYYFRLKVKLAYKGEPQDFDIVVGCNVHTIRYKDNSSTYEAGLVPTVFGRRMSDGAGLVVRPPDACPGQTTANGKVPKDFIPLVIVYDDANTLAFGTAYMTEDAYHNPLSVLTFGQATIETATRADFDAFRARETNIVTAQMYFADSTPELNKRGLAIPNEMFGGECHAYARFRLVGAAKVVAQRLWPISHSSYWAPQIKGEMEIQDSLGSELWFSDREGAMAQSRSELYASFADPADKGVAMLSGSHPLFSPATIPATIYPDIGGWIELPWPAIPSHGAVEIENSGPRVGASVDYRDGATLGFAYCYAGPGWYPTSERGLPSPPTLQKYRTLPGSDRVDGVSVEQAWRGPATIILERDEFFLRPVQIFLDSTRGDV